jgi:hypothetical protein
MSIYCLSTQDGKLDGKLGDILALLTDMQCRIGNLETFNTKQTTHIDEKIDTKVREVVREELDKERRKLNLIIHGIEEKISGDNEERNQCDMEQVGDVLSTVYPEKLASHSNLTRLGEK